MSIGTVGIAAVLLLAFLTLSNMHTTARNSQTAAGVSDAKAEITRLINAVLPTPSPRAGQWSSYHLEGAVVASVQLGSTPPVDATASVPIDVTEWSNSTGASCTSQQLGTASFSGAADAQAWQAIGLIATPANQPATGCDGESGFTGETLPDIDGSTITHDPETLAGQLESGTTGLTRIDGVGSGVPPAEASFIRLTDLLVGPITGAWSGLGEELLRAMSLLPGVVSLGNSTTHTGQSGLAFTSTPQPGAVIPVVVLDPDTGSMLEARNLDMPLLTSAAEDFVSGPSAPVFSDGVGYGISAQWIDPAGPPSVIGQSDLPAWTRNIHIIEASTKPTTTSAQVDALVQSYMSRGDTFTGVSSGTHANVSSYDITVSGTAAQEGELVSTLAASQLFTSISVLM